MACIYSAYNLICDQIKIPQTVTSLYQDACVQCCVILKFCRDPHSSWSWVWSKTQSALSNHSNEPKVRERDPDSFSEHLSALNCPPSLLFVVYCVVSSCMFVLFCSLGVFFVCFFFCCNPNLQTYSIYSTSCLRSLLSCKAECIYPDLQSDFITL